MPQDAAPLYPLEFAPIYKEKVWGGRTLEKLGRVLPGGPDTRIGESWELADLGQTSASGGGGAAERSRIAAGAFAGRTFHELLGERSRQLLGDLELNEHGEFPLLLKYLDARENLSVQVHPSPAYAATHANAFLKSEAWYIVDAEPGAVIYKGVKEGVTPEQFRSAIEADAVEPLLIKVPVQPGDCHYLPSGTCHALGAGVLVAEVQTPSDTTFRVYDWGRTDRELHIEQAMQCIHFGPPDVARYEKHTRIEGAHAVANRLVDCEHFRIERIAVAPGYTQEIAYPEPAVWMFLAGTGQIRCVDGPTVALAPGRTVYLPPALRGAELAISEPATWLEITFPQAETRLMA